MRRGVMEQMVSLISLGDGSTLTLDFTTGVLDSRLTFTRASTGTRINASGFVETMSNNVARFDYDPTTLAPRGLLVEGTAVNLGSYSEDYSQATWSKVNVDRTTGQSSPDNQTGATLLTENTTSYAKHSLERTTTITAGVHTFSVWVKGPNTESRRYVCVQLADGQATAARYTIVADLQTGTITASGANNGTAGAPTNTAHSITSYLNGWYRLTITMNCVASPLYPAVMLSDISTLFGGNNQPFYSAASPYKGLIVWGAQLEAGSGASSYIPTGASQATRNPDNCSLYDTTTSGNLSWFKTATQGTFYVEAFKRTAGTTFAGAIIGTRANSGQDFMLYQAVGNNWLSLNWGASEYVTNYSTLSSPFLIKAAVAFSPRTGTPTVADSLVSINGANSALNTTPNVALPFSSDLFCVGARGSASGTVPSQNYAEVAIRRIKFFPTAMTAAQLNAMTTL
jgi:hypothetical protein